MSYFEPEEADWTSTFVTPRNFIEMATDLITKTELENFRHNQIESNRRELIKRISNRELIDGLHSKHPRSGFVTKFKDYLVLGVCDKTMLFAMPMVIHQRFELVSSPPMKEFSLDATGYQTILLIEPVIVNYPNSYDSNLIPNPGPAFTLRPDLIKSDPENKKLTQAIYKALRDNYEKARDDVLKRFLENTKLAKKQDWINQGIKDYKQAHCIKDSL